MAQTQVTRAMNSVAVRTTSETITHSFGTAATRYKCRTISMGTCLVGSEESTPNSSWALGHNRGRSRFENRQSAEQTMGKKWPSVSLHSTKHTLCLRRLVQPIELAEWMQFDHDSEGAVQADSEAATIDSVHVAELNTCGSTRGVGPNSVRFVRTQT